LKIPSKFDFRLGFSDFDKIFFAMSLKYGNLFMVFFKEFFYYLLGLRDATHNRWRALKDQILYNWSYNECVNGTHTYDIMNFSLISICSLFD
jgi:hypothetical protein